MGVVVIHVSFGSGEIPKMGAGSPTDATYIHRLSSPPPPPPGYVLPYKGNRTLVVGAAVGSTLMTF